MVVLDKYNLSLAIFQANISSTRVELFAFPLREVRKEGGREKNTYRQKYTDFKDLHKRWLQISLGCGRTGTS